jgi:hypothetical protein
MFSLSMLFCCSAGAVPVADEAQVQTTNVLAQQYGRSYSYRRNRRRLSS